MEKKDKKSNSDSLASEDDELELADEVDDVNEEEQK